MEAKAKLLFGFRNKTFTIIYLFLSLVLLLGCQKNNSKPLHKKPLILVSIPPYCYFVDRIAGGDVEVQTIVSIGANPHLFEPAPRDVESFSKAIIWFHIGESFESKIMPVLKDQNPRLKIVDVKNNISLLCSLGHSGCGIDPHDSHSHREASDLHIWLSPNLAQQQAKNIANTLVELFPEKREVYLQNLNLFIADLEKLDEEIRAMLKPMLHRALLVSHPAFSYFCKDYGLVQISVEHEGKDPLPKNITHALEQANQLQIKKVILQPQYNNKGAEMIADKLKLRRFMLDPYSLDYISNLRLIAATIADSE